MMCSKPSNNQAWALLSPDSCYPLLFRTLLQQLQRLQAIVAGKVSRSYKAASTQTGTCLMVSPSASFLVELFPDSLWSSRSPLAVVTLACDCSDRCKIHQLCPFMDASFYPIVIIVQVKN